MTVDESALLNGYLLVGAILFGLGLVGFLSRRNMILMFLAVEIMLQGVSLSLTAWSRFHNNFDGQMLVLLIITVAACEAAIALPRPANARGSSRGAAGLAQIAGRGPRPRDFPRANGIPPSCLTCRRLPSWFRHCPWRRLW